MQYKDIENYRKFKDVEEKSKYIDLLSKELKQINKLPLIKNSQKIYEYKYEFPKSSISQRSFDFKNLEEGCRLYIQDMGQIKETEEKTASTIEYTTKDIEIL